MRLSDAISLFDDSIPKLAAALEITPQAIYQWPDELDQARADRVRGAAIRLGKTIPATLIDATTTAAA